MNVSSIHASCSIIKETGNWEANDSLGWIPLNVHLFHHFNIFTYAMQDKKTKRWIKPILDNTYMGSRTRVCYIRYYIFRATEH